MAWEIAKKTENERSENPIVNQMREANINRSRQPKKRGRPKKLTSKTSKVYAYLDHETHIEFQAACHRKDISESAAIRKLIIDHFL